MAAIDQYLLAMLEMGGSDLHLSANRSPRVRISGSLQELDIEPFTDEQMGEILKEITTEHRWELFKENGEADLAHEIEGSSRFRVNLMHTHLGMGAVFRQIPSTIATVDELKLPRTLKKFAIMREGLVLVTGPTGSGKSTTLAAILDEMNRFFARKIITIEDPVEFVHQKKKSVVIHREVGEHCNTFERALRSSMRADPDVILIGEMRDRETMKLALACASMGMLVFATLHTNSASKTIDRVVDAFPADEQNQVRVMLAESLRGIVSQLLCKKLDGGRQAVHEILLEHEALAHTIRQHNLSSLRNIIDGNRASGMISMDTSIREAYDNGLISGEEAFMKASDKTQFLDLLEESRKKR